MRILLSLCLVLLLPGFPAWADTAASALVHTEAPKKGSVPEIVTAYGSAVPAANHSLTISLPRAGRVQQLFVTAGEAVQAGQNLLEFALSASAVSTYQQAVTALDVAQKQRTHTEQLLQHQLATRDQLAQAEKAVNDAQAALDALRLEGGGSPTQTLTAPFDGIVTAIPVAQGARVAPNTALMTLARTDGLIVTVGIVPSDQPKVHAGQKVALTPLTGGNRSDGKVLRVDSVLNAKSHLIDADISVPSGSVLAGAPYQAAITVGDYNGWLVPRDAVLTDNKGPHVFQVADGKAARVDVKIVGAPGKTTIVNGPIDPGRQLVVVGNYQLTDGMPVRDDGSSNSP